MIKAKIKTLGFNQKCKMFLQIVEQFVKHITLLFISYSGFIRFMDDDQMIKMPMVMGHAFELFTQSLPLMSIQILNNSFVGKFSKPLDSVNVIMSAINFADLLIELGLSQYISAMKEIKKEEVKVKEENELDLKI